MEIADTSLERDFQCPMCSYSLRGLIDPRCPECGFAFTWEELQKAETNRHPYLFEVQTQGHVGSFFRTFVNEMWPNTFWTTLSPAERIKPKRLVVYWFLSNVLLMAILITPFVISAVQVVRSRNQALLNVKLLPTGDYQELSTPATVYLISPTRTLVSTPRIFVRARFDATHPTLFSHAGVIATYQNAHIASASGSIFFYLTWPWLTAFSLMIFQASMHRARINSAHILRCVIYSCNAPLIFLFTTVETAHWPSTAPFALFVCMVFGTYRLGAAYKKYMRIDHPLAVAISSQVIVFLLIACATSDLSGWFL